MIDEKFTIHVTIAGRRYGMDIKRSEEEKIRKAAKIINERTLQYQQMYSGKDNQDFLAMAIIQFAIQLIDLNEKSNISPAIQQINEINDELNRYLDQD